jgi:hypothetical protein
MKTANIHRRGGPTPNIALDSQQALCQFFFQSALGNVGGATAGQPGA